MSLDNKVYSDDEINKIYKDLVKKYNGKYEGVALKCETKKINNEVKYFYEIDSLPVHKCAAIKLIKDIYKKKKKSKKRWPKFENNKFN